MNKNIEIITGLDCTEAIGPWPFITRRTYRKPDRSDTIWRSRHHRKGLPAPEVSAAATLIALPRCLWMPWQLNWWIGVIFAIGSLLFALASVLSLWPHLAAAWFLDSTGTNAIFFTGSVPFTIAAYLQLFQAANAGELLRDNARPRHRPTLLGWRPRDIGWLSGALQFGGTILFNVSTFDSMLPALDWLQQDIDIWAPDIVGSILFLASGYLAFIETCHAHWKWKVKNISWWVTFMNLLGCVGFMISAVFAFVLPGLPNVDAVTISVAFTLLGAVAFFVGSLLMLPETAEPNS
ncbi:MAG: hypothetical protein O7F69_03035 [Alphaproteobacteria bacterium]|nr:hypothetical protein [Alphaproteobacteria bacterium]